ncbi:MAG TPA: response regulator transcription factor [Terriglobales bacterium]|nr:response regulator transcription factor [Terriglobales bacterium]
MSTTEQIRIFSVDDHPLLHEGLATVIRHQADMQLIAEAENGQQAIQRFREHMPDVTLMDLRLPDMSGIDAMIAIRSEFPEARVIILTTFAGDVEIQRAVESGARAYVLKTTPPRELVQVIRDVHAGKTRIPEHLSGRLTEHHSSGAVAQRETVKAVSSEESSKASGASLGQPSEGILQRWLAHFRGK